MSIHSIKIGNVNIENNIFLAPMAGITDKVFRGICKSHGAGLVYTEMVSAKGIFYNDTGTKQLLDIENSERPVAIQLFGNDADVLADVAEKVQDIADIIDINFGCPAPKIVKNDEGSKLMLYPNVIDEITKKVVKRVKVPVTIKIRKGWDEGSINAVQIAKIAESNGVAGVAVHGRTREQFYSGAVDYDIIRSVKENVSIPVIASGDILNYEKAIEMFEKTNCDGIMVARGSLGNPWIFDEILLGEKYVKPTQEELFYTICNHLDMEVKYRGERTGVHEMRKMISWYIKGVPNATEMRCKINTLEKVDEVKEVLRNYILV